jgi:hypothetical protein
VPEGRHKVTMLAPKAGKLPRRHFILTGVTFIEN